MANTKRGYNTTKHGHYKVYYIENKTTGKGYVGYTLRDINLRWSNHKQAAKRGNQSRFYHAIRKYGVDDWDIFVLAEFNGTRDEAYLVERFYIENLQTHELGYNANVGGTGGWVVQDKDAWLKNRPDGNGLNNPNSSGLTDEELLQMLFIAYKKFGNISCKKTVRKWLHQNGYPKSLRPFRYSNYNGSQSKREIQAFCDKYNISPKDCLTKKAYETWQK